MSFLQIISAKICTLISFIRVRYFLTTHYFYSIILSSFADLIIMKLVIILSHSIRFIFFPTTLLPKASLGIPILENSVTQRRTTVSRTSLDEWSARRRDLYLSTHNTHNRHTSMPPVGFKPTISAGQQPQTYALDRTVTGTGSSLYTPPFTSKNSPCFFFLIYILRWSEFLIFLDFRSCISETAFLLWYDTTSLDTLLQVFRGRLIVCYSRETIIHWHSVTSQKNGTFCVFVCTRWIAAFSR